ncbi:unnamed protein product [Ixodes hexagonus]
MRWPFYWELHRFLGSLPVNNTGLVDESSCSDNYTPEVVELLSQVQGDGLVEESDAEPSTEVPGGLCGAHEDGAPASTSAVAEFDPQPSTSGTSATGSRRGSTGSSSSTGSSGPHSTQPRGEKRKRPQAPIAAFFRSIVEERRLLRLGFEGSREREFGIRERELKLQEEAIQTQRELAKAMMAFLNKTTG